jgi:hemoglobin
MQTVCEAAGGADGLLRLASAWHARVMADEVVSHAFSHGFHPEHSQRLAAYWRTRSVAQRRISDCYGDETSVVRMHSGNGPHQEMDRRAIACFDQALVDVGIASDAQCYRAIVFSVVQAKVVAEDVPDGLHIPQWSWDGLVDGRWRPISRHSPVSRSLAARLSHWPTGKPCLSVVRGPCCPSGGGLDTCAAARTARGAARWLARRRLGASRRPAGARSREQIRRWRQPHRRWP